MDDVESIVKKAINSINTSSILKNNIGSLCDTANEKHDVLLKLQSRFGKTVATKLHSWLYSISERLLPELSSINLQLQKFNLTIINTALIIDKLNKTVTNIISRVKEENYLSIFPALNAFLVEKAPEVKTEIKERVVNYI
jgi:RNA processing factor Prp31